jgi:hypothetical protein
MGYALLISIAEQAGDDAGVVKACDELAAALPLDPAPKDANVLQKHRFWNYHANRHKGEALYRLKQFAGAADCFAAARKLAFDGIREFDATQTYRWQILMGNRQADALWEAGRKDEAVDLRRQLIAKFDRDWLMCNNCIRVKASLIRDLRAAGKAEEAWRVFTDAIEDARLDSTQKAWLSAQADGKPWQPPKPDETLVTYDGPNAFVIRSEGRWEMRVDLAEGNRSGIDRYGPIGQWYDLADDPLRERNLTSTSFFPLLKPHHVNYNELRDGKWQGVDYNRYCQLKDKIDVGQTKQQNTFEVLEAGPARVRCGYTHKSWPNETLIYTFYPDGRLYVGSHWSLVHPDKDVKILGMGFYLAVHGTTNWRTTIGKLTAMLGEPSIQGQAPFTMMHTNGSCPHYTDPTTTAVAIGPRNAADMTGSYGNNCMPLAWFRSPVQVRFKPDENPEKDLAFLIHFWPNGRSGFEAEKPYMDDFQNPAALDVSKGERVLDDAGDYDHDGFNEAEGCYVVRAAQGAAELSIDGTKTVRHSPVFKCLSVKGTAVGVTLDGKPLIEGTTVATWLDEKKGTAIVRIIGPVTTAAKISISVK